MDSPLLKITLEFPDLSATRDSAQAIKQLDPSKVHVTDLNARPALGASDTYYFLEFIAQIPTGVGIGLLANLLYEILTKGKVGAPTSRFKLKIGDLTIECDSREDLAFALEEATLGIQSSSSAPLPNPNETGLT